MSTELRAQEGHKANLPKLDGFSVGIVVAEWNPQVTEALLKGALDVFHAEGYTDDNILVEHVPGTPDIVLGRYRTVIFVNGCFWHGHEGCRYFRLPKTNAGFWQQKIERNQARDARDRMELRRMGWHVIQVWECQLKPRERAATLRSIEQTLCGIYLDDNAVERTDISLAAEDETPYNNSLHNK